MIRCVASSDLSLNPITVVLPKGPCEGVERGSRWSRNLGGVEHSREITESCRSCRFSSGEVLLAQVRFSVTLKCHHRGVRE